MADDMTTPPVKTYGLADFVTSSNGQTVKSKKSWGLYHSGDFVVLRADKVAGVSSITVRTVRIQEETHTEFGITTSGPRTISYAASVIVGAGQEKRIECLEQTIIKQDPAKGIGGEDKIGNVDITVTLVHVAVADGSAGAIDDPADPNIATYTWVLFNLKGEEITRGDARSISDAKTAAAGAAKAASLTTYSYKVFDEAGNQVYIDNVQPPGGGEFPWWIVGAAVVAAVIIVVIWYFYRRSSIPASAAPAVAPVATPSGVGVVK